MELENPVTHCPFNFEVPLLFLLGDLCKVIVLNDFAVGRFNSVVFLFYELMRFRLNVFNCFS